MDNLSFLLTIFLDENPYIQFPGNWIGWLGLSLYFILLLSIGFYLRDFQKRWVSREWVIFFLLFIIEIFATLFIGISFPISRTLPSPGLLASPVEPVLMVFSAIPWILASGLLGYVPSMFLAGVSGLLIGLFNTHNPFSLIEFAIIGLVFGIAVNQRFRTSFFKAIRHPILISVGTVLIYPPMFILDTVFWLQGDLPVLLDYAISHLWGTLSVVIIPIILASMVAEVMALGYPEVWGRKDVLLPSPAERSLEVRSLFYLIPAIFVMLMIISIIGWRIASDEAEEFIENRMKSVADSAAEGVPYFLEVGQNSILEIAEDLSQVNASNDAISRFLIEQMQKSAYFDQIVAIDLDGSIIPAPSSNKTTTFEFDFKEQLGVNLALDGIPFQYYAITPPDQSETAWISFIVSVRNENQNDVRAIVGRTNISTNPFALSILKDLESIIDIDGEGILLDENGMIIFHPITSLIMTSYAGEIKNTDQFFSEPSPDGTRNIVFSQPTKGRPWTVIMKVPAKMVQQRAFDSIAPIAGLFFILSVTLILLLRVSLGIATKSLRDLTGTASKIASDQKALDQPLSVNGFDEASQMRQAFEEMRASLQTHLSMREIEQRRLEAILESSPDPVLVIDQQSCLLLSNQVARTLFGNTHNLIPGTPVEEFLSESEVLDLLRSTGYEPRTKEITLKNGQIYLAKTTSVMIDGQKLGVVCVFSDVTRFKEMDSLKSEIVSTVSHDLRSPLTLMRGYTTMLQVLGELNDEQKKYVSKIDIGIQRMSSMVSNLLDLERIEAGIGLNKRMFLISDLVSDVIMECRFHAIEKRIKVSEIHENQRITFIEADPELFKQALNNLIENAIKYTMEGGEVQVVVQEENSKNTIVIEVRDNGIGISPADQMRLFEKFYRVPDRESRKQRGSGLGLAIVKSIAEAHGGRVWVNSELGVGSTFYFEVPDKNN